MTYNTIKVIHNRIHKKEHGFVQTMFLFIIFIDY